MRNFFLSIAIVLCLSTNAVLAGEVALKKAENLLHLGGESALAEAYQILDKLVQTEPENTRLLNLLVEVSFSYGDWLEKEEQIKLWEKAQMYAEKAAKLEPYCPHGHYWVAALMGKIGRAKGIIQSLFFMNPMLKRLDYVLELDPDYSWAYYVLSQMYQQMPPRPLGKGDPQKALTYAQKAWELEPEEAEFSLLYAQLLVKNKKQDKAVELLKKSLEEPSYVWEEHLRQEAENLYQSLDSVS